MFLLHIVNIGIFWSKIIFGIFRNIFWNVFFFGILGTFYEYFKNI